MARLYSDVVLERFKHPRYFGELDAPDAAHVRTPLRKIAAAHGATPSQVALNWLAHFHGDTVVVIPGATKRRHAEENVGSMGFKLSQEELRRIDELSRQFL